MLPFLFWFNKTTAVFCLLTETEISTAPSDHSKALQVYRKDSKVTSDWQEVLEPICAHKVTKLEKMLRDHSKMHPAQHAPPLTTIAVRWHSSGPESTYTHKDLCDIFSKVGSVTAVTFQSSRSAHVVFDSVNSACHAVFLKNLGHASCPLHTQWLPGAVYNLKWNKKQSLAKPFTPSALSTRFISPQAITRPSQICCRVCTTEIKQKR